jgi:hypothetical protein
MIQSRPALLITLCSALVALGAAHAQMSRGTDPPIIIGDGSLVLKSPAGPWKVWNSASNTERAYPQPELAISAVRIESDGTSATIDLSEKRSQVTVVSGSTTVDLVTVANGRGLRVRLRGRSFADFRPSEDDSELVLDTADTISSVQVRREGQLVLSLSRLTPKTTVTLLP